MKVEYFGDFEDMFDKRKITSLKDDTRLSATLADMTGFDRSLMK